MWVSDEDPEAPKEALPSSNYVPRPEPPPSPVYAIWLTPIRRRIQKRTPEEDHADYPANGGDGDDESSDDDDKDDDADDQDEEAFEDKEEEEHLAPNDSSTVLVVNPVPLVKDTEAFETDESAPIPPSPRSPQIVVPLSQTRICRERKMVRPQTPIPFPSEAEVPPPPLPVSSLPLPLPSPPTTSPTYAEAPLGYRLARIRMRAVTPPLLLPSTSYRTNIPEAEMPAQKKASFTTPASRFEVRESSAAAAARQPRPTLEANLRRDRVKEIGYGITNTWDEIVKGIDRPYHRHTAMLLDREATYRRRAYVGSKDKSAAIEAHPEALLMHWQSVMQTKAGMAMTTMIQGVTEGGECLLLELALMCQRLFPEESDEIEKYVGGLSDMIHGSVMASKPKTMLRIKGSLRTLQGIIKTNNSHSKGTMWHRPILHGLGRRNRMEDLNLCALNETTTMMVSAFPNVPTARGLVIKPRIVEAQLLPIITRDPKGKIKESSLVLSVEVKVISRVIARN
ncbi:hypothetical protein Tco_0765462 [Tanacetum coccineum]